MWRASHTAEVAWIKGTKSPVARIHVQLKLKSLILSHSQRKNTQKTPCLCMCPWAGFLETSTDSMTTVDSCSSKHRVSQDEPFCLWTTQALVKTSVPCCVLLGAALLSLAAHDNPWELVARPSHTFYVQRRGEIVRADIIYYSCHQQRSTVVQWNVRLQSAGCRSSQGDFMVCFRAV